MNHVAQTNEIDVAVGARLYSHRTQRQLTQARLAEVMDVAVETIQSFEVGGTRLSAVALITAAAVLGVVPSDLLP